jgi:hypothetical protein
MQTNIVEKGGCPRGGDRSSTGLVEVDRVKNSLRYELIHQ